VSICVNCKHWTADTYESLEPKHSFGECSTIRDKLDIEVHYGWDGGYVMTVETEGDFGCVLWTANE